MYFRWLVDKVEKNNWGNRKFMVWKDNPYDYNWLLRQADVSSVLIKANHIESGRVCAILGDYSPYSVALILALIENKNIVVPIATAIAERKRYYCDVSQAEFIFEFNGKEDFTVIRSDILATNPLLINIQKSGSSGLVLFTSGSTGNPKAALYDLDKLLSSFSLIKRSMRSLVFLQLDHIGGINTLFSLLSNGGEMIILDRRIPADICAIIEKYKVELFPTTPSFLNLLKVSEAYKEYNLTSLKLITYGTEVMPESLLKKLIQIFPGVEFKQTYGLTEVGILRTKSRSSDSSWVKVGGENFKTKIVDGILWVKTDFAIAGYLNAPNPFTDDGWLVTRDKVEVDGEFIKFLGREEDIINVGGLKVYPLEVEDLILQMENVSDAVVLGEKNHILGNIVCAKIKLKNSESLEDFRKRFYDFFIDRIERYKIPQKIEIINGELTGAERFKKIRRNKADNLETQAF